jgi:hypothetical protein
VRVGGRPVAVETSGVETVEADHPELVRVRPQANTRAVLAVKEPMDLGPVLHLMHSFLPRHELVMPEGASRTEGVLSSRRREVLSLSPGVDGLDLRMSQTNGTAAPSAKCIRADTELVSRRM